MIDLKNYSTYSQEFGFLKIQEILESESVKQTGVACLTEDSTLYSAVEFIEECEKKNIKPIIGLTVHIGHDEEDIGTLTLYAKNRDGFQSLVNIVNSINKNKNEDRLVDITKVIENKNNLVAIMGGYNSIIYRPILNKDEDFIHEVVSNMKEEFGKDLYLEVQKNDNKNDDFVNSVIKRISEGYDIPYVATNDNRFNKKGHFKLFLQKAKKVRNMKSEFKPLNHISEGNYVKTVAQSENLFFKDMPEAVERINEINNKTESYSLTKSEHYIPNYEKTLRDVLRENYSSFIKDKNPERINEYKKRVQEELEVIESLGFGNYFLIFDDIVRNNPDINFGLRGSSIGSLVTHMLKLSPIDPVENGLLFERFLNTGRGSRQELPDIDIETDNVKDVLNYLKQKYGENRLATLATTTTRKAKNQLEMAFDTVKDDILENPIDDKGNARFLPEKEFGALNELLKASFYSKYRTLSEEISENYRINKYIKSNPEANKLVKMALLFEDQIMGINRTPSSYVITPYDYTSIYSSFKSKDAKDDFDFNVIELSKSNIEKMGLVKIDILSNVYLSKILKTCKKLNINLDSDNKYEAPEVYELLNQGFTKTINQLKSPTQAKLCKEVGISNFNDIVNIVALLRPGVNPQDRAKFIEAKKQGYSGPKILEPILKDTYGIIIFDEQVMNITKQIGGFSPSDADKFRSALKGNKLDIIKSMEPQFIAGAQLNGTNEDTAKNVFNELEKMAGKYTFSKAHSLAYSHLIYQQTWLKANHPAEYFEYFIDSGEKQDYVSELQQRDIKILPLDINRSINVYKTRIAKNNADQKGVDFSLSAVFNDNDDFSKLIVNERVANGKYKNLYDFVERLLPKYAGIPVFSSKWNEEHKIKLNFAGKVDALIKMGAFDKIMPSELNNNVVLGREVMRSSINSAIDLVLKPFVNMDFEYIVPDRTPKDQLFIEEEKRFYGGISFIEAYQYKKLQNEKKNKMTPN